MACCEFLGGGASACACSCAFPSASLAASAAAAAPRESQVNFPSVMLRSLLLSLLSVNAAAATAISLLSCCPIKCIPRVPLPGLLLFPRARASE